MGGRRGLPPAPPTPRVRLTEAVPGLIKHLPHHKPYMITLGVISVVVVLALCGLSTYMVAHDDNTVLGQATAAPTARMRDIGTRATDDARMTAKDVFPSTQIVAAANVPPYKQVGDVQVEDNCRLGATGTIATMLVAQGCNQMVRATFSTPDGTHFVTAGIFNLVDDNATKTAETALAKVDAANRFTGYITTTPTQVIGRAPTNLAYLDDGHFLLYVVIVRTNGTESKANDASVNVIVYDMLEHYLRDTVMVKWQTQLLTASAGSGGGQPTHTPSKTSEPTTDSGSGSGSGSSSSPGPSSAVD
jgi:hypothetical protein